MRLRNGAIRWEEDRMHGVGCMEKLEDNQVSDIFLHKREKDESVQDFSEKLGQSKRK